jgi:ribosomal protein S18 acetylase RimI-like enzyme
MVRESDGVNELVYRRGAAADVAPCVSLWVEACAARDGRAVPGVADRARPKFDRAESWIVAERRDAGIVGFVLATVPGSGLPSDPPDAPVVGLLAVAPGAQRGGVGADLLSNMAADLTRGRHTCAVLHVLADNHPAVRLYASQGWRPLGEPFQHSLLNRPTQTYMLRLTPPSRG